MKFKGSWYDYGEWYADNEDRLIHDYAEREPEAYQAFLDGRTDSEEKRLAFCASEEESAAYDKWCEDSHESECAMTKPDIMDRMDD